MDLLRGRTALLAALLIISGCSSSTVIEATEAPAVTTEQTTTASSDDSTNADPTATAVPPTSVPEPTSEPDSAADAPGYEPEEQLQALADLCSTDDVLACDVLFLISEIDSSYEDQAASCNFAGIPETGWCTDGVVTGPDGLSFDESSPGLDGIATECTDGNMVACDFLYFGSPAGGEWESFGDGCGGRTDSAFPDCRTEFG